MWLSEMLLGWCDLYLVFGCFAKKGEGGRSLWLWVLDALDFWKRAVGV